MNAAALPAGEQRCLFGTAEAYCGKPAHVHVLVCGGTPTMDCEQHTDWWVDHDFQDMHLIGPTCGLPGTTWTHERCLVEGLE